MSKKLSSTGHRPGFGRRDALWGAGGAAITTVAAFVTMPRRDDAPASRQQVLYEVDEIRGKLNEGSPSFAKAQAFFDRTTPYTSHSDLVVAVRPGEIDVIGGNVSDTVLMKTVPIDAQGRIADQTLPWFAVLRRQVP